MAKLIAVRTDPVSGRALLGSIEVEPNQLKTQPPVPKLKKPGELADPHHPQVAILLTVKSGSHTVFVAGNHNPERDGRVEECVQLNAGDKILFCDFAPAAILGGRRFCYAGHRSQAGPNGAELEPAEVIGEVDLDALGWVSGIPS